MKKLKDFINIDEPQSAFLDVSANMLNAFRPPDKITSPVAKIFNALQK